MEEPSGEIVPERDLRIVVSNIGVTPGFSSIYTSNSASHTAFVQVSLKEDHQVGSYEYMSRVKQALQSEMPQLTTYFSSGSLVDAVLNMGLPAPIDVQVAGNNLEKSYETALKTLRADPQNSGRGGRLHSAGYRLSGAAVGYRPHARRRRWGWTSARW